jgi:hypothetical protein
LHKPRKRKFSRAVPDESRYVEELRASTKKGYREIWINHISKRVGSIRMREFRTVDASRMLKAIADENDLTKTTLQQEKTAAFQTACIYNTPGDCWF